VRRAQAHAHILGKVGVIQHDMSDADAADAEADAEAVANAEAEANSNANAIVDVRPVARPALRQDAAT